ncbi:MAG: NDP-sugar synthase [Deltaproteobacteria bacterium]|nr:NDP-sugar synthase [Deltaproteobacteria bacterium]
MKAMVVTAGLGTRLRPLTLERAKPAIPLLGKPLIVWLLEKLIELGCTEFRLNLHHLPRSIERIFASSQWSSLPVSFSHEPEILGTAGGLKANEAFFDNATFLMVNGDVLFDFPLDEAIEFHQQNKALATLILFEQTAPFRYSPIKIDEQGQLAKFKDWSGPAGDVRPETFVFTGLHILEPEIFRYVPRGVFYEINDQTYPAALRDGQKILGFPVQGYWNDLGDPTRYLQAQQDWFIRLGISPQVRISPDAQVDPSARLGPFVSVETGCRIESESVLENSILWEDTVLASGCSLRHCIVAANVTVRDSCSDRIITRHGEVALS